MTRALLASGAPIGQMNTVRKHLSRVKGGQLAAAAHPARLLALAISDVPGDDPAVIASGPTAGEPSTPAGARAILDRWRIAIPESVATVLDGASGVRPPDAPELARAETRVIAAPSQSLAAAAEAAEQAGVDQIIIDPGFGFGKSDEQNLRLVNEVDELLALNRPVLVGVSRKSTIGATLGTPDTPAPVEERLYGSLGATAVAVMRGATIVRSHDVAPTVEMLKVLGATLRQG